MGKIVVVRFFFVGYSIEFYHFKYQHLKIKLRYKRDIYCIELKYELDLVVYKSMNLKMDKAFVCVKHYHLYFHSFFVNSKHPFMYIIFKF